MVASLAAQETPAPSERVLILVGAPGDEDYVEVFAETVAAWHEAATAGGLAVEILRASTQPEDEEDQKTTANAAGDLPDQLREWIASNAPSAEARLWLVFVGHGSFDGRTARMNLPGPDLSAPALREILEPWTAPLVFVHGGSASAPFLSALSGENRIVVTATESGSEVNYARFGLRFAEAVGNPEADIDQDGITSVLEAFVTASLRTQQFYEEAGRLATEHAMIDDNGDARGTPYDFFNGTRLVRRSTEERISPDGGRARVVSLLPDPYAANWTAAQLEERDRLETELEAVRLRKEELDTDAYYRELEQVLRQLGELYLPDSANDDS